MKLKIRHVTADYKGIRRDTIKLVIPSGFGNLNLFLTQFRQKSGEKTAVQWHNC